jgi:hypothetical protein
MAPSTHHREDYTSPENGGGSCLSHVSGSQQKFQNTGAPVQSGQTPGGAD